MCFAMQNEAYINSAGVCNITLFHSLTTSERQEWDEDGHRSTETEREKDMEEKSYDRLCAALHASSAWSVLQFFL